MGWVLAIVCLGSAWAQEKRDSTRSDALRLGLDIFRLGYGLVEPSRASLELSADYNRGANLAVVELGQAQNERSEGRYTVRYSGLYGRLGYERNLFYTGEDLLVVGGRLAWSQFDQTSENLQINSSYLGSQALPGRFSQAGTAWWVEATAGLKVSIYRNWYAGFTARVKVLGQAPRSEQGLPWAVPGYGKLGPDGFNLGISYYLIYRIPFRTEYRPPLPKKRD